MTNGEIYDLLADLAVVSIKFGVAGFSIEENIKGKMVRGMGNTNKSPLVLCHPLTQQLPFQALAVSDIGKLNAGINMFKNLKVIPDLSLNIDDKSKIVRDITMKHGKTKLKITCANPAAIDSPKGITDVPTYKVLFNEESLKVLSSGVKSIDADNSCIQLCSDGNTTLFIASSSAKDELTYELPNSTNIHTNIQERFAFKYPISSLTQLLNLSDVGELIIGKRGVITAIMSGYTYHLFPVI